MNYPIWYKVNWNKRVVVTLSIATVIATPLIQLPVGYLYEFTHNVGCVLIGGEWIPTEWIGVVVNIESIWVMSVIPATLVIVLNILFFRGLTSKNKQTAESNKCKCNKQKQNCA